MLLFVLNLVHRPPSDIGCGVSRRCGLMALEGEHCCEGVTGAAAIDVILNGEKPADPTQIAGKFTGGDARVAADA
jgi:hypothetical protein